ncbi:MAG TPA: hypothetical protein VFA51_07930 [Candidatus Udaeobacter sp.]|nr:hypothetical protein [Candidatus Udaeobacter sp.]
MRIFRATLIAVFTALVGCVLAFFVGDYLSHLAHMSNMEGSRGMFVIFVSAPLGMLSDPERMAVRYVFDRLVIDS